MKKRTAAKFLAMAACLACASAWAHFPVNVDADCRGIFSPEWTPLQLGIYPRLKLQLCSSQSDVYGVAAELLEIEQRSAVVSCALLSNRLQRNYFLQTGFGCTCEANCALQIAPFNFTRRNFGLNAGLMNFESNFGYRPQYRRSSFPGVQIGFFNAGGGIQIGLLNYNPQALVKWFPLVNFPWPAEEGNSETAKERTR